MERLLILVASHFLGDFPFQSEWMVKHKGKDFVVADPETGKAVCLAKRYEVLLYHVATYVSTMYLFMRLAGYHPTPQGLATDATTHFVIDALKVRGVIRWIWLDQLCHLAVRLVLWRIGWL